MSGASTTRPENGAPVKPDRKTKRDLGIAYTFSMAVIGFLALQVWMLNGRMERMEAAREADQRVRRIENEAITDRLDEALREQKEWNARVERALERMSDKLDELKEKK